MITYQVNQSQLKYVEERLGKLKNKAPSVIATALNKTAVTARQKLATQIKSVYSYNKSTRSQMVIKRASAANLQASVDATGRPHRIVSFRHSSPKRAGAKAAQMRSGGLKSLTTSDGIKAFKQGGMILQRKGMSRYPLRGLHGSSTPVMLRNDKVFKPVNPEIQNTLKENIERQIRRLTG